MRWIRHRDSENKRLFPFNELETYNDCDELIICLSERSLNIILNALTHVEEMQTRVWTTRQGDLYQMVNTDQFQTFNYWMSDVYNQLGSWVMCNEKLERIAVALETMVQQQDESVINLQDVFEALGLDPSEENADILEALQYIIEFPGFDLLPDFKIPKLGFIQSFMEGRYRSAHLQLLRDISISQRGQAVAQGGVDFASLYDTMGESVDSMLVGAGYAGKAYWIWRWIDNDQIPGWAGWITTISGLVLGSIRNATYDLVEAVLGLDLGQIADSIRDQTVNVQVNCGNCSQGDLYNIMNDHTNQEEYAIVEHDSTWGGGTTGDLPVSDDTTWDEPAEPTDHKCQAANFIVGWIAAFYGRSEWEPSENDTQQSLADKIRRILAELPSIGATLNGMSQIIARLLSFLAGGDTDIFETVNTVVTDLKDDLVCALYTAEDSGSAIDAFMGVISDDGTLGPIESDLLRYFLVQNNIMALLWYTNPDVEPEIAFYGDDCDCGVDLIRSIVSCGQSTNYTVLSGSEAGGAIELESVSFPWSCNPATPVDVILMEMVSGPFTVENFSSPSGSGSIRWWGKLGDGTDVPYVSTGYPPDGTYQILQLHRNDVAPFTVEFDLS